MKPPVKDFTMKLYFKGLLPLIDISHDGQKPACECSHTPFNPVNHVLESSVTYKDGAIFWHCSQCGMPNIYKVTNDGITVINKPKQEGKEYTLYGVIARVQTSDDNIDYHAWRVRLYPPVFDEHKMRGYGALSCKYMGYVNDSSHNDGYLEIVGGHNRRSAPTLKRGDLRLSLALLLRDGMGFYEEACEGCGTVLEVNPSFKHSYDRLTDPLYCCQCRSRMME